MTTVVDWLEGHEIQPNILIPNQHNLIYLLEQTNLVGISEYIIHLGRLHRRFQIIKHGNAGVTKVVVDVSDDVRIKTGTINPDNAGWLPIAITTIDATAGTVDFNGEMVPLIGELTCGFVTNDGWKFVRGRVIEHTGDPVSLILGV